MALNLLDKLTNFLMVEEEQLPEKKISADNYRSHLKVHTHDTLRVMVVTPAQFDDVVEYAKYLKNNMALIVNIEQTALELQRRIFDYLNGVSYILGLRVDKVSENVLIYVPANVEIAKELYAYSIPTYVKI